MIKDKILQAGIDIEIELEKHDYIKSVEFFYTMSEKWYSYRVNTKQGRSFYPSASNENIKIFKTLNGAKRNFIKTYLK